MGNFGRGVTSQLRRNACMRGLALDFDQRGGRAFAPHHQTVGRTTRLEVEGDVMLLRGFLDQLGSDA